MKKLLLLLLLTISAYANAQTADSTAYKQKYKNRVNMGVGFTALGGTLIGMGFLLPREKGGKEPGMFLYFGAPAAAFGIYSLFSAISPYKKYKLATGKGNKSALYFAPQNMSLTYNF